MFAPRLTRPNFAPPPGAMGAMGAMGAGPMGPGPMGPMAGHIMQQSMSGMGFLDAERWVFLKDSMTE